MYGQWVGVFSIGRQIKEQRLVSGLLLSLTIVELRCGLSTSTR